MRLPRPHIPDSVKCEVALRALGEMWPLEALKARKNKSALLAELLARLADLLGVESARDLRLDHQPALALRSKIFRNGVHVDYDPPSASIEHLIYRTHQDHLIKTNVRGDGAQFSDWAKIRRERRQQRRLHPTKAQRKLAQLKEQKRNRDKALRLKIKKERKKRCRR